MNFSRKHKCVFILDKYCGEKNITQILKDFDFRFLSNGEEMVLDRDHFSNMSQITRDFQHFTICRLVDNPYRYLINSYKQISKENWDLKTNNGKVFTEKFNKWLELYFENWDYIINEINLLENGYGHLILNSNLTKKPDFFIHRDKMVEDLKNIPLFENTNLELRDIFFPSETFDFKNIFSYENARKIFYLNRDFFIDTKYDPFSFTTTELTHKQKVDFIHW